MPLIKRSILSDSFICEGEGEGASASQSFMARSKTMLLHGSPWDAARLKFESCIRCRKFGRPRGCPLARSLGQKRDALAPSNLHSGPLYLSAEDFLGRVNRCICLCLFILRLVPVLCGGICSEASDDL